MGWEDGIYDEQAERAVLGSVLYQPHRFGDDVLVALEERDFYLHAHRLIYRAISEARREGQEPTLVALRARLDGLVDAAYLLMLEMDPPNTLHFESYCRTVRDLRIRRSLHEHALALMESARDASRSVDALRSDAESMVIEAVDADQRVEVHGPEAIRKVALDLMDREGEVSGLSTGLVDLDRLIGGLVDGNLYVVAGRPGMGKTAFALNILRSAAEVGPVGFFSLEMTYQELGIRLLSAESGEEQRSIARNHGCDWSRVKVAAEDLSRLPFYVIDRGTQTPADVFAWSKRLHRRTGGLRLLIIDYVQLVSLDGERQRWEELGRLSSQLKALAKDLSCPVLALAQLNREVLKNTGNRPMLHNLAESGNLERDADVVVLMHRPAAYGRVEPHELHLLELIVAKNRQGEVATVETYWRPETMEIRNWIRSGPEVYQ